MTRPLAFPTRDVRGASPGVAVVPYDFDGQPVRVATDEHGEPRFVVADVARILGYRDAANAARLVEDDERGYSDVSTPGGPQTVLTVTESGLYALVFRSSRPDAVTFRRWVTGQVLPSIRRTGGYVAPVTDREKARALALAVIAESDRADAAEAKVAELEPRAYVADTLLDADGDQSVGDTAKELASRAGVDIGARRLFDLLEDLGWIYKERGDGRWHAYQRAVARGLVAVKPQTRVHPDTGERIVAAPQVRVTPKGLERLLAHFQPSRELVKA